MLVHPLLKSNALIDQTIDSNAGGGRSGLRGGVGGGPRGHPRNSGGGVGGSEPEGRTLSSLGAALRKQGQDMTQQVVTLQRSSVGIATVMRKLEAGLHTLSTKDIFWQVCGSKVTRVGSAIRLFFFLLSLKLGLLTPPLWHREVKPIF